MTNTPTNYSYDTIPGTVEEDAPKKDKNVRRKKTVGVVASGILGVLCLAFLVIGYGSQDRPGGGTTAAASSSSVSVLPLDPADRVADCQQLCASRPLEYCKTGLNLLYNYYADSEMADFEYALLFLCVEDE